MRTLRENSLMIIFCPIILERILRIIMVIMKISNHILLLICNNSIFLINSHLNVHKVKFNSNSNDLFKFN